MRIQKHRTRVRIWLVIGVVLLLAGAGATIASLYLMQDDKVVAPPAERQASAKHADAVKKTPAQKASYEVAADHPRELIINKIGVNANILPMGVLSDGSLKAPASAWDVGWYDQSALPGSGQSALLIDGHVNNSLGTPGIFYKLDTLVPGDEMQVQRGDKQVITYRVVQVDEKPIAQVDMAKMLRSITPGKQGLNLITCGGDYDYQHETYRDRILVYSEQVS